MIKLSYNSTLYSYDGNTETAITNASELGIEIHSQTDLSSSQLVYEQESMGAQSVPIVNNQATIQGINLKSGPLTLYLQVGGKLSNGFTVHITKLATPSGLMDDDPVFTVDRDRRIITIPDTQAILAVVRDTNSEIIKFKFPRYADGVDLSTKTAYVNFVNATGNAYKSLLSTPQADEGYVFVEWVVGEMVTVQEGGVLFQVEFYGTNYRWQTQIAQLKVVKSLEAQAAEPLQDQTLLEEYLDRFNRLIADGITPIVDSVDEMVDTSKQYILKSTGTIWAYKNSTSTQTLTKTFENTTDESHENPYLPGRLSSDGAYIAYTNCLTTPWIDIGEYTGTIKIKFGGLPWIPESAKGTYNNVVVYDANKNIIAHCDSYGGLSNGVWGSNVVWEGGNAIVTWELPKTAYNTTAQKYQTVRYVRVSVRDTTQTTNVANSDIKIEYTAEVTSAQWVDTGIQYGSGGLDAETAAKISALNNEGNSPSTIKLLPKPVLDFYNSAAYSDSNYSYSHLEKITYPCRADIPVPYTVKWSYNESAMRTTVAVDTKAIGTVNAYTMRTYDATGLNKFPIYNLLPNKTYYYKVTHVMQDGSLVEAKSGSFTTSSETWRLIYIDGTQNVRDLGGWAGLNGKKVKYGKIFRGAALNDSSLSELMLTGKGRRSLGELAIQAELNLGAIDTETSIAANCVYKKIGYTNYAIAFTGETYRAQFKEVLEWIVAQLTASKPIYMHCQGGCDRTGTLAFQLLGLLGVSESDLAKEYELSSFSNIGFGRLRTTTQAVDTYDYVGMVEALKAYSGATVADKFYDFATTGCSISADTITNFRNLMLE